jgi:iron complex outermembrane receptor protein
MGQKQQRFLVREIAWVCAAFAAVCAATGAAPALAQGSQAAGGTAAADSGQLTTITVTANRRIEDQQKVGVSVTALSAERLAERNIVDLSQIVGLSPGFTFGKSGVDARPAIRGVRTENVAVNADTTIGFFVDGIYKSRAQQAMLGFVDVGRVEIQRGPQGTLFGRNTFGGNIVVTTNAPEIGSTEVAGNLTLGSFGKRRFDGAVNVSLSDSAALRFAGAVEKADPWVKNDFNPAAGLFDQDLRYLRASLLLKPTRDIDVVLRWACDGHGIVMSSRWLLAPSLASGRLVQLLPQWQQTANIYAVSTVRSARSAKVRLCVEALREQMAG